jgi:DNA modification methylase/ParB-like chromosome segregation protein Spo0J
MPFIKLSEITISPNRQRQDFDPEALTELANSIATHGLLHAPVLRMGDDGQRVLVAGERRLRAIETLYMTGGTFTHDGRSVPPDHIPFTDLGDLSPIEAEEAELDENLRRVDLTWQEVAAATARLHALRSRQAEAIGKKQLQSDTAAELHPDLNPAAAQTKVANALVLSRNLEDPDVAKAKSAAEATKIIAKKEQAIRHANLATTVGRTFNSSIHELHHTDCITWLTTCPHNTFDVILTDPPYGMNAQDFGDGAGRLVNSEHHYDDSYLAWQRLVQQLCPLLFAVSKPEAHAYIFCDIDRFHELKAEMTNAGWYVFRTPIINYKPNSGRVPLPDQGPRRQYEICLYAIKGKKKVNAIYSDVIPTVLEENLTHGAQKPVELYENLLKRSVVPGNIVLDAFAGTGTIFPAAHKFQCKAVGLEMSPEYYGISVTRLNSLDEAPNLL